MLGLVVCISLKMVYLPRFGSQLPNDTGLAVTENGVFSCVIIRNPVLSHILYEIFIDNLFIFLLF